MHVYNGLNTLELKKKKKKTAIVDISISNRAYKGKVFSCILSFCKNQTGLQLKQENEIP